MQEEYRVTWEIDVTAENVVEAAEKARAIQRDPDSTASVYTVDGATIDLDDPSIQEGLIADILKLL